MANPPNSFSKKSLANDDKYSFTEEALLANANLYDDAANILTLDVMSNDSGGAKSLFSIDDGNGSFLQDLLTNNINTGWEETANGNRIRIYNGKIQVDITNSLMAIEGADFGLNALRASDSIRDSFNYAIRLPDGTLSWAKVKIDIRGANDLADITGTVSGRVAEDATMTTSGTLNVTDADHGEAYFKSVAPAALRGTYGNFTFNAATGEWDYTLNNGAANVQALAADSVVHDKLTVSSLDGTRQTIDVTINGANDAPVVTRTSLRADGHGHGHAGELSGKIAFTDADAGDEHTASVVLKPLEASAGAPDLAASLANALQTSINEQGRHNNGHSHHKSTLTWDFNLPDGMPHLAAGQTVLASYRIIIADNNGAAAAPQDISVLIVGTDGEPQVFTVAAHADLTELADTTGSAALDQASGLLSGDGFDLGEHSSLASALLSSSWSAGGEIPAENAAALASAISLSTVLSDDDHHGDDDGAVAWHFNTPDSTFDFLAAGETLTLAYRVTFSEEEGRHHDNDHHNDRHEEDDCEGEGEREGDSDSEIITITITGTNDAPIVTNTTSALVGAVQEDAVTTVTGQLSATDVDNGATQTWSVQGSDAGSYGSLAVGSSTGLWIYTLNNAAANVQALAAGEFHDEIFTVRVDDGQGGSVDQTVTVTVSGTNESPVITNTATALVGAAQEDVVTTVTGQLSATDVDNGATQAWSVQGSDAGSYGSFAVDSGTGLWTYTLNNADANVQALAVDESHDEIFIVRVDDGQGGVVDQTVTVTVSGTNDAPVITNTATALVGAVQEDAVTTVTGQLSATDLDNGATQAWSVQGSETGSYGSFAVDSGTGLWTYTLNNDAANVQALAAGDSHDEIFIVRVDDGQGGSVEQTVTVTVSGTNDMPTLGGVTTNSVTEDATNLDLTTGGRLTIADADAGQSHFAEQAGAAGAYGTFTLAANGAWTYTANNSQSAIQQLGVNQSITDSFTAVSSDGSASQVVTVTINGTNDAPVITNTATALLGAVQEDAVTTVTGQLSATDLDNGATQAWSVQGSNAGAYGSLAVNSAGLWTYSLNNEAANVQALAANESYNEIFTVRVDDGKGGSVDQTVTVTVNGANDTPDIRVDGADSADATLTETNTGLSAGGTLTVADTDLVDTVNSAVINVSLSGTTGILGVDDVLNMLTVSPTSGLDANSVDIHNLSWNFNSGSQAFDYLESGQSLTLTYTVRSADNSTASDSQSVVITIDGTADNTAPVADAGGTYTILQSNLGNGIALDASASADDDSIVSYQWDLDNDGSYDITGINPTITSEQMTSYGLTSVGNHTVNLMVTDSWGFTGVSTADIQVIDDIAPDAGTLNFNNLTDTGTSNTPVNTQDKNFSLSLSGQEADTAVVYQQSVNGGGWVDTSFNQNNLADGTYQYRAVVTDAAGNSSSTAAISVIVDNSKPNTPLITGVTDNFGYSTGSVANNGYTDDLTPTLAGTAEADSTVTIKDGNTVLGTAIANGSGSWSYTTATLTQGSHSFTATASDAAGNESNASSAFVVNESYAISFQYLFSTISTVYGARGSQLINNNVEYSASKIGTLMGQASYSIDVKATSITVTYTAGITWSAASFNGFKLSDVNGNISDFTSVSDTSTKAVSTFDGNNIYINWQGQSFSAGESFTINFGGPALLPAGVSGEAINLALTDPTAELNDVITLVITGMPSDWILNNGTLNTDGSWTVETDDPSALSVTTATGFTGALLLQVHESWTNADGTIGTALVTNNVEAYAPGSPIFAWSGDDNLTGGAGNDLFVFGRPTGNVNVFNFDASADKIDLMGFGFTNFSDVQAHLSADNNGNTVLALADGQNIVLKGVDPTTLTAGDFVFDELPVTLNSGNLVVGDGALLPLAGIVNNTGTINLSAAEDAARLEVIGNGISLQGHGLVTLSDNDGNIIFGSTPDATLTNIDNTISGAGSLGGSQMSLDNQGVINANGTHALVIDTGSNTVINSGTLEASGTGGLYINSALLNDGQLWAHGGNITIDGNVTGAGSAVLDGTATIVFGAASSANITFDTSAAGTVELDHSVAFSGTVAGWNADDMLDLLDINASNASLSYVSNDTAGGVLTVTDGTHTANITLIGLYDSSQFVLVADANGGTMVNYA